MRKYLQIIDRHRATKWTRFANLLIDRVIFSLFFFVTGFVVVFLDNIFGIYFFTDYLLKLSEVNRVTDIFITSILFFFYTFLIEYFTKGRTIGKFITGTKVIMIDGQSPTLKDYFIRNIIRIIPFDGLSFLGENGWHDGWSGTRVINIKNYEAEKQTKSDIEDIGKKEIA